MRGKHFTDATYKMTIWCELPTWEQRLEFGHERVKPAHEFRNSICG